MVKIPRSQHRGHRFGPWPVTKIPHAAWSGLNKMKNLVSDPSEV